MAQFFPVVGSRRLTAHNFTYQIQTYRNHVMPVLFVVSLAHGLSRIQRTAHTGAYACHWAFELRGNYW
jgi:hypothetical protein